MPIYREILNLKMTFAVNVKLKLPNLSNIPFWLSIITERRVLDFDSGLQQ